MESEKLKTFQKLLEWISLSIILSTNRAGRARAEEETDQELGLSGNTGTYLNNPSEEAIFGSNKIKEETLKH